MSELPKHTYLPGISERFLADTFNHHRPRYVPELPMKSGIKYVETPSLSDLETQYLVCIAHGYTKTEIKRALEGDSVDAMRLTVSRKLGTKSNLEAVIQMTKAQLIDPSDLWNRRVIEAIRGGLSPTHSATLDALIEHDAYEIRYEDLARKLDVTLQTVQHQFAALYQKTTARNKAMLGINYYIEKTYRPSFEALK